MSNTPATAKAKIRCTDHLGNVAYIHNDTGSFRCVLANGMLASMFYAVGNCDEVALVHNLTEALDEPERLLRIVETAARGRKVEMVSYKAAPKAPTTAKEMLRGLTLSVPDAVVYADADGTTYTGEEMASEIEAESPTAARFAKDLMSSGLQALQRQAEHAMDQIPAPGMGR